MATKRDRKTAFPFIKPKGSIKKDVQQYRWVDVYLFVYRLDETISFGRIFHFSSLDFELINVVPNCLKQRAIESVGGQVRENVRVRVRQQQQVAPFQTSFRLIKFMITKKTEKERGKR